MSTGGTYDYRVLRELVTAERLSSYEAACPKNLEHAFHLYEWNMHAAGSILSLASMVEVIVRNAIDTQLSAWSLKRHNSERWFNCASLDQNGCRDIQKAVARATRNGSRPEKHGKVIAELSLGFWRYLSAKRYLTSMWIPTLSKAFPRGPRDLGKRRKAVESHLAHLVFIRNRAAHHEPIHSRDLRRDVATAIELADWISRDAAAWITDKEPVTRMIALKPTCP